MPAQDRITLAHIDTLSEGEVFVFGSNLEGMHGAGAARAALKWGARMGLGIGISGNTYAIPTMFPTVSDIKPYVKEFINYARLHRNRKFLVTKIGCGIAGFTEKEIAPLFADATTIDNIALPEEFWEIIAQM